MLKRKKLGMSLIELVVTIGVLSFFSVGIGMFFWNHTRSLFNQQRKTQVQSELREFLGRVNKLATGSSEVALGGNLNLQIKAKHSDKCLAVDSRPSVPNNLNNGVNIFQWNCSGEVTQTWRLQYVFSYQQNKGGYQVIARHSNKCVDVSGISTSSGANVLQWECLGETQTNQVWRFDPVPSDTTYFLRPQHIPGNNLCLTVEGSGMADGTNVLQQTCTNADNQRWVLRNPARAGIAPQLNILGNNPVRYSEIDFAQRDKDKNFQSVYFSSQCVTKPAGLPDLPASQDCMSCPSGQMPIVTNGLGSRVFPIGDGVSSSGPFAASLCITEDYNTAALALKLTAYAIEVGGSAVAYELTGSIPRASSAQKRIQLFGN